MSDSNSQNQDSSLLEFHIPNSYRPTAVAPPCEGAIPFVYLTPEHMAEAERRGEPNIVIVTYASEFSKMCRNVAANDLADQLLTRLQEMQGGHPANDNFATVTEYAAHIRRSRASVYELIKKGLPTIKGFGRGKRIVKAEADEWLKCGGLVQKKRGSK